MQKNQKNNHLDFTNFVANGVLHFAEALLEGIFKAFIVLGLITAIIYIAGVML